MACKTSCKLCDKLIISQAVTYASGVLTINIPAGTYVDGEKYCIVIAQAIPTNAIIGAPIVITIGTTATTYPLLKCNGVQATVMAIRTRTRYATRVITSTTGGSFKLLGKSSDCPDNTLPSIGG